MPFLSPEDVSVVATSGKSARRYLRWVATLGDPTGFADTRAQELELFKAALEDFLRLCPGYE